MSQYTISAALINLGLVHVRFVQYANHMYIMIHKLQEQLVVFSISSAPLFHVFSGNISMDFSDYEKNLPTLN